MFSCASLVGLIMLCYYRPVVYAFVTRWGSGYMDKAIRVDKSADSRCVCYSLLCAAIVHLLLLWVEDFRALSRVTVQHLSLCIHYNIMHTIQLIKL